MRHILYVGEDLNIEAMLREGVRRIRGENIKLTSVQGVEDALLHLRAANDEPCLLVIGLSFRKCIAFMRSLRQPDGNKKQLFEGPFVFIGQSNRFIGSPMIHRFVARLQGVCYDTEWMKVTPRTFEGMIRTLFDPYGQLHKEAA